MTTPRFTRDRFPIIPADWSAEQAYAAFELLDELQERIWARYAPDIQALIQQQQHCEPHVTDEADPDLPPFRNTSPQITRGHHWPLVHFHMPPTARYRRLAALLRSR